jgi:hypothetical protein
MLLRKLLALLKSAKNLVFKSADGIAEAEVRLYEEWFKGDKNESN